MNLWVRCGPMVHATSELIVATLAPVTAQKVEPKYIQVEMETATN